MNVDAIVFAIDAEISRLQQARALLSGANPTPQKRTLSPEARARIVAAQKKRWAAARQTGK